MPTFEIEQYEIHTMKYRVEAQDEAEAIAKLLNDEVEPVDDGLEYIEICEDRGLPIEEHLELAERLRELGVTLDEATIPSVRSVVRVNAR